jgi:hypothetical protein
MADSVRSGASDAGAIIEPDLPFSRLNSRNPEGLWRDYGHFWDQITPVLAPDFVAWVEEQREKAGQA